MLKQPLKMQNEQGGISPKTGRLQLVAQHANSSGNLYSPVHNHFCRSITMLTSSHHADAVKLDV